MNQTLFNRHNLITVTIITLFFGALSLLLSFMQTPKYLATSKIIVVFNQNSIDPYTASRSSDYIAGILGEVAYSNSFISQVYKTNPALIDNLGTTDEKRLNNWKNMVTVKIKDGNGIMEVAVLHPDRDQAEKMINAIITTIKNNHQYYHGFGSNVLIRTVNEPSVSDKWAEPKILRNSLLGLVAGLFLSLTLIVIFPQQRLFSITSNRKELVNQYNNQASLESELLAESTNENLLNQYQYPTPHYTPEEPSQDSSQK
ncbi:MAG: hypothetical protein WCL61_00720 [bacterium]